jgi:competence protein ComGC
MLPNKLMKRRIERRRPSRNAAAFTRTELMVVIVVFIVVCLLIIPALQPANQKAKRISCLNHLMQISIAYRVWENDHRDHYPAFLAQTNGGWSNYLSRPDASTYCWMNYAAMANQMGQVPQVLVCPSDERKPASAFSNLANTNISYFVGVNAADTSPQSILGGDRNLGPGTTPAAQYGFSPSDGKGNDVVINGPVCWSLKMHSRGNSEGAGNILLGDGSAQETTSAGFRQNWQPNASGNTNWPLAPVPSSASFRLIFP